MASKGVCNVINQENSNVSDEPDVAGRTTLSDAARRALAEAAARRRAQQEHAIPHPGEVNGRQGPEPVRYGDWENKGIASDF